jgi:hypothetical protein
MVHETFRMEERAKPQAQQHQHALASAGATSHGVGSHDFRSLIATGSLLGFSQARRHGPPRSRGRSLAARTACGNEMTWKHGS